MDQDVGNPHESEEKNSAPLKFKVLLVEGTSKLEALYSTNLKMYVAAEAIIKRMAKYAIELLESTQKNDIDLIITRSTIKEERTAYLIDEYLVKTGLKIPVIVIGFEPLLEKKYPFLEAGVDLRTFIKTAAKALGVTAKEMVSLPTPEFVSIPANHISLLRNTTTDIYIKISREGIDDQYVKRLFAGDYFTREQIIDYVEAGLENFYIESPQRLKFTTHLSKTIISQLNDKDLNDNDRIIVGQISMELLSKHIHEIGLTNETVSLARATMKSVVKITQRYPEVNLMIKQLLKNKISYQYKHVQLLTLLCLHMTKNIDWAKQGNQDQLISFVCFFHDISLLDDDLVKINDLKHLKLANLDEETEKLVLEHAMISAEIVYKFPSSPMSSEVIIRQHHGSLNGVGFDGIYGGNLSPITLVFMLAEEIADMIISAGETQLNKEQVFKILDEKYTTGRFQKIIDSIRDIMF